MTGLRLDRVLAGTALALVLAAPGLSVRAQSQPDAAVESRVPMPDLPNLPPPGLKDVTAPAPAAALSPAEIEARVPMPDLADLPPPTAADIGPVRAAEPTAQPTRAVTSESLKTADSQPAGEPTASTGTPAQAPEPVKSAQPAAAQSAAAPIPAEPATQAAVAAPSPAQPAPPAAPVVARAPEPAKAAEPAAMPSAAPRAPEPTAVASVPAPSEPKAADPVDTAVAEKLQALVADRRFQRIVTNRHERSAIESFYEARSFGPIWTAKGGPSERAKAVMARLEAAESLGLDPADYKAPDLAVADPETAAEAEVRFASLVLTFARHVQSGRTDPSRISSNIEYTLPMPEPSEVLAQVAGSSDIAKTFASFEPPHEGYKALKRKLAELRGATDDEPKIRIAHGPALRLLKKAAKDERVPALRARLGVPGGDDQTYDADVAAAVKKFQQANGIAASGTLTQATIDALNGPRRDRQIDQVVASMERWRWLPRDLGKTHVILNIPDFTLRVMHNGNVAWRTRVVVGKPSTPTPTFSGQIENILVNPTWYVPDSITYGEYLPALERDSTVLARMGLKIEQEPSGRIRVWQPPGPGNALGRIKFNFQNKFQVYMHDTPDKHLFAHDRRAYSHGCMRVQNPDKFGEVLASFALPGQGYTAERLTSMYGKGEAWLKFTNKIPVHLTYMTAFVDDDGKLVTREDIYGLDTRVLAALKGDDRDYGQEEVSAQIKRSVPPAPAAARLAIQNAVPPQNPIESFFRLFR